MQAKDIREHARAIFVRELEKTNHNLEKLQPGTQEYFMMLNTANMITNHILELDIMDKGPKNSGSLKDRFVLPFLDSMGYVIPILVIWKIIGPR